MDEAERIDDIRGCWLDKLVPRDAPLTKSNLVFTSLDRELEEPLLSVKKKRILATAALEQSGEWHFVIPAKSYEVWTLLCLSSKSWLDDFILPQKVFSQPFAKAKKALKKDEKIPVSLRKEGDRYLLTIHDSQPVDVTDLRGNYEPLQ
jgi:hypothetical protein